MKQIGLTFTFEKGFEETFDGRLVLLLFAAVIKSFLTEKSK